MVKAAVHIPVPFPRMLKARPRVAHTSRLGRTKPHPTWLMNELHT